MKGIEWIAAWFGIAMLLVLATALGLNEAFAAVWTAVCGPAALYVAVETT